MNYRRGGGGGKSCGYVNLYADIVHFTGMVPNFF